MWYGKKSKKENHDLKNNRDNDPDSWTKTIMALTIHATSGSIIDMKHETIKTKMQGERTNFGKGFPLLG